MRKRCSLHEKKTKNLVRLLIKLDTKIPDNLDLLNPLIPFEHLPQQLLPILPTIALQFNLNIQCTLLLNRVIGIWTSLNNFLILHLISDNSLFPSWCTLHNLKWTLMLILGGEWEGITHKYPWWLKKKNLKTFKIFKTFSHLINTLTTMVICLSFSLIASKLIYSLSITISSKNRWKKNIEKEKKSKRNNRKKGKLNQ